MDEIEALALAAAAKKKRSATGSAPTAPPQQSPSDVGSAGAFMSKLAPGMSFGFADEIAAGIGSMFEDRSYDEILSGLRKQDAAISEKYPKASIAGEIVGAVAVPGVGGAKLVGQAPTLATKIGTGAATGATTGGTYNFGTGEGGFGARMENAKDGALFGAGLGALAPAVGGMVQAGVQRLANSKAAKTALAKAPSGTELRRMASDIFNRADDVTGLSRAPLTQAFPKIQDDALRMGMDDILTPQSARAVSRAEDAATSPQSTIGFRDLDILRRQAQVPASSKVPVEAAIGSRVVDGIDEIIDATAGDTAKEVAEARAMWGKLRRSEKIEEAIRRAGDHPSGFAQGIQIEFRSILRDPKKLRGFSEAEQAAIRKASTGLSVRSVASAIGKFAPRFSGNANVVGQSAGIGTGGLLGGLVGGPVGAAIGAAAVPAASKGVQVLGDVMSKRQADLVRALVANGGQKAVAAPGRGNALSQIVQALMLGTGGQASQIPNSRLPQLSAR